MYLYENGQTIKNGKDGQEILANFVARIVKETRYHDANEVQSMLTITGENATTKFEPVKLPAEKFPSMSWVMPAWGVSAVVQPGTSVKENLRTAIQLHSKPEVVNIYTHTGWSHVNKEWMYLHAKGAITGKGPNPHIEVALPPIVTGKLDCGP